MSVAIDEQKRKEIEAALLAALLLIYRGSHRAALAALGVAADPTVSPDAEKRIAAFAQDRAEKIADGINGRMDAAGQPDADATPGEQSENISDYNAAVLAPFLRSWAWHQGMIDAYRQTPAQASPDDSALDETSWVWTQTTDYNDECTAADAASPASYDDLIAITGAPPPVHERCQCLLAPVE